MGRAISHAWFLHDTMPFSPSESPFCCIEGIVPLRAGRDPQSGRLTDLLFGETFSVRSEHEGLAFGTTVADRVEGFVPSAALALPSTKPTHRVGRTFLHLYDAADLTTANGRVLPLNAAVAVTGRSAAMRYPGGGPGSRVVELASGGWVTEQGLMPLDGFGGLDPATITRSFLGAPYLSGGRTYLGCDGPGLIQSVLAALGIAVPRDRVGQMDRLARLEERGAGSPSTGLSVVYVGEECGLILGETVIAARRRSMVVDATSLADFLCADGLPARTFAIPSALSVGS